VLWLVPLACAALGLALLAVLASRLHRELEPTALVIDRFGREHRVALSRLRDHTDAARRRNTGR
jgi:hypothetical protein